MGGGIGFSFREGKRPHCNALNNKKIIQSMMDTTLNVGVCLEIPIAKCVSAIVLVVYIIFYDHKNVIY